MAEGGYGIMVPAGDAPALARAIAEAAARPQPMRELGARGAERVRTAYSDQAMVARLARIYEGAIATARAPSR
jgi:glycosyltransferase involved in cell wall biosynthesis